ncbi:MAG: RHS repeat-associated core domain-containing protein [Acidobacteriota bacterium]
MRHRGLAFILALLLSAPAWGARAPRPDAKPETFEPGTGKYILVLKDPRTDTDDPATGKKKAKEPNVVKHGGKVLHKKEGLRIIKLPTKEAKLLRLEENVAYLQRVWLGEPLDTWGEDDLTPRTNIEADAAVRALDNDLTWTTGQYLYDGSGNIKQIGNDTYRYDTNGRLAQAVVRGVTETYQYDAFGNLTQKSINGAAGAIAVDPSSNRLKGEAYDAAGNLTTRAGVPRYDYDSLSMIDTVIKPALSQTQRIIYGPNDERIGVILEEGVLSRWKIRDFNGKVLREFRADDQYSVWQWMEDYVYVEGRLLAAERDPFFGGKRHFHTDHLGSVRMITDQNRMRISTHDFLPFGVEQTDATQEYNLYAGVWSSGDFRSEPMKFTGHERDWHGWLNVDNDDSLDYMHARYYDPNLGRFLSVDPVISSADPQFPQSWNRYAYALNNPLKYIDPTGENATVMCDPENNCTASVEAQIVADPNSQGQMAAARDFANGAINYWQGRQEVGRNGENITFQVNISIVAPGQTVDGVDTLTVVTGAGRSNVQMTLLTGGGNGESASDTGTIFTIDNTNNPAGMFGVAPHETGHLFGLRDLYSPAGVGSWNTSPTESIMMYGQPTNAVSTGWWVLHPANGNSVVRRQQGPPRHCMTGPC